MADVEIRSLRVSAQMDASQYAAGAQQKVAADQSMVASGQAAGQAVAETNTKISQAGDVLSRLSRQYVDGYAAAQRFNSALMQLSSGIERGKISAEATGPILDGIYRKYGLMGDAAQFAARGQMELATAVTNANAKLAAQQRITPANMNANQGGAARFGAMNAASQFQDIVVTSQMGQSPLTIMLQQGTQLGQALQMEMGDQGAKGLVKGLGAAFANLLSPVNLLAIGLTGVAAVAIEFGSKLLPQVKSLKDATTEQTAAVHDLAAAYHDAKVQKDDFYTKSVIASESGARRSNEDLQKAAAAENLSVEQQLGSPFTVGRGRETFFGVKPEFSKFGDAISILNGQIKAGRPDYAAFEKSISDVVANNPGLQTTADKILGIVAAATEAAANLKNTADYIKDINRSSVGNFDRTAQAGKDQSVMSQRFGDDPFAQQREQERQKVIALKEAQDQRNRSLDNTLKLSQLDVDLVGKTTAEVEGLRMAAQLEAQVREEAAKSNVKADETEIANIRAKAAEYGKLKAIEEARTQIKGQQDDLELQRGELATVGENTLARTRAADALKIEQDIRKLGIPLYGQEANAMRANTAALSDQAAALAKATMQADLLFERSQILRNSTDQAIASAQHSAGLPVDLNSAEANMMRYNMALQESKDTFKGFFSDMQSSLEQGKTLWESFGDAAKNALTKIADKFIDRGLDDIFNSLVGGPQSGGSGLIGQLTGAVTGNAPSAANQNTPSGGGILSSLFGIGGSRAQSVASMEVQAAVVNVNGGVGGGIGGGLSDILSKLGSPSFKADTTLSDILGYGGGAANQNMIQSRIDQAFGTGGSAQDMIQSRIDQAFGTAGGLGGIFTPAGGFASSTGGAASAISLGGGSVTDMIRRAASAEGINPDVFLQVAKSEGGLGGFVQSSVFKNGIQEPSYGPMQLLKGGPGTGFPRGLGNAFQEQTGLDPADPSNMEAGINFAAQQAKQSGWSQWYGAKAAGISKWQGINRGDPGIDPATTDSISKLGDASSKATSGLNSIGGASQDLISQFSKMGQSLLSQLTPATSSTSWFQGLAGMFGGNAGALGYMNSISPAATSDILSGSWGLFANGAAFRHGNVVPFAYGDVVSRPTYFPMSGGRTGMMGEAGDEAIMPLRRGRDGKLGVAAHAPASKPANDQRPQIINQTNNFLMPGNPAAPASQNQIAAKSAKALERLQRTA